MVELLFDEGEHRSRVVGGSSEHVRDLRLHHGLLKNSKTQTEGARHQNGDIVEHHRYEGSPKHDVGPDPADAAFHKHGSVVHLYQLHETQLIERITALTITYHRQASHR